MLKLGVHLLTIFRKHIPKSRKNITGLFGIFLTYAITIMLFAKTFNPTRWINMLFLHRFLNEHDGKYEIQATSTRENRINMHCIRNHIQILASIRQETIMIAIQWKLDVPMHPSAGQNVLKPTLFPLFCGYKRNPSI